MKLAVYSVPHQSGVHLGAVVDQQQLIDLSAAEDWAVKAAKLPAFKLPSDRLDPLLALLNDEGGLDQARAILQVLAHEDVAQLQLALPLDQVTLQAPIAWPPSVRDCYAFEQHVKAARANRGLSMPPEWYELPVFYFSNHHAISGPFDPVKRPKASNALDFELEIAAVIGTAGIDIPASDAEAHIAGYLIMNDWSARDLQAKEMKLNLGPAKGKDFATTLGPWLVTPDELEDRKIDRADAGRVYDLQMIGRINGREVSRGNWRDMHFTFAQLIERASQDAWVYPGDIIGSGTVGTGCLLELTRGQGPWLQPGDVVELEIERVGIIRNQVAKSL